MRKLILCLSVFVVTGAFAQTTTMIEKKRYTENGITKGWDITKEVDANGNVLSYDSTYYEREATPEDYQINMDEFGSFGDFDGFGDFGEMGFDRDSMPGFGSFPDMGMGSGMPTEFPEFDQMTQSMLVFTDGMMRMTDSLMSRFMGPNAYDFDKYMDGFEDGVPSLPEMPQDMQPEKKEIVVPKKQKRKNRKT